MCFNVFICEGVTLFRLMPQKSLVKPIFAQLLGGAQELLDTIDEFPEWCGLKVHE